MNWKLILQLSMFGLAMGAGSVFVIPAAIEPVFWLVIFLACAYIIARRCPAQRFQHGLFVGLANCVWITLFHILFLDRYLDRHQQEAALVQSMAVAGSPTLLMFVLGSVSGFISGTVIGLLSVIAGKVLKPARA